MVRIGEREEELPSQGGEKKQKGDSKVQVRVKACDFIN